MYQLSVWGLFFPHTSLLVSMLLKQTLDTSLVKVLGVGKSYNKSCRMLEKRLGQNQNL